nr:hypothetical protein [Tanacetum cinerariifolium]
MTLLDKLVHKSINSLSFRLSLPLGSRSWEGEDSVDQDLPFGREESFVEWIRYLFSSLYGESGFHHDRSGRKSHHMILQRREGVPYPSDGLFLKCPDCGDGFYPKDGPWNPFPKGRIWSFLAILALALKWWESYLVLSLGPSLKSNLNSWMLTPGVASASLGLVAGFVIVVTRGVVFAIALILIGVILGIGSHGWCQLVDTKVKMNLMTQRKGSSGILVFPSYIK